MRKKGFACLIAVCMILACIPGLVFASGQTTTSGKLVISDRQFEIAPDITEREYITNNSELTAQQSGHVMEVKLGENAQIIAGYNDYDIETIKSGSNWGMRRTTEQAQGAEKRRDVNVVGAVNGDFFDMSNGRPRGVLVMNSTVIQKSAYPCFYIDNNNIPHIAESSANLPDDVKEAVGGAAVLVSDGRIVNAGDKTKNPRTCIGIKDDNTVVIYMVDGRQAPLSIGMDYEELAQTMIDLGCVSALNLDGGGSSTFATQRAGDTINKNGEQAGLTLRCSPSDGYERTVSSSLFVVSTTTADGIFDRAIISPNQEVYTPGSEIQFTAQGADRSGAVVNLPSGLTWKVNNTELGTINTDGKFTATRDKTGTVAVSLMDGDEEVGRTTVELQWPDKLGFTNSSVSLDFGETSDLSFNPTYKGRAVHYKDGDFEWSLEPESYKHETAIETYYYEGWLKNPTLLSRARPLNLIISGNIGNVAVAKYSSDNNLLYETSYKEESKITSILTDGTVQVSEKLLFNGAKKYDFEGGGWIQDIYGDIGSQNDTDTSYTTYKDKNGVDRILKVAGIVKEKHCEFSIGKFNSDNTFTADKTSTLQGKIKASLANDSSICGNVDVIVGIEPYVLMDFEDKVGSDGNTIRAEQYWSFKVGKSEDPDNPSSNKNGQLTLKEMKASKLWMRDANNTGTIYPENENRLVEHDSNAKGSFGRYGCQLAWDFSDIFPTAVGAADFGYAAPTYIDDIQPRKLGVWINVPGDLKNDNSQLKAIMVGGASKNTNDSFACWSINEKKELEYEEGYNVGGTTTYFRYYSYNPDGTVSGETLSDWAGKGWIWVEADISSLQFPISVQRAYTIRIVSPQNCTKGSGHILIDNLQMIYGTNTNDINNPVIDSVTEKTSGTELETAIKPEFASSKPQFDIALSDNENTDKYATGIDANSIRVAIDGTDYTSEAEISAKGVLFQTRQLTNGEHSITIRVKDYYGNETTKTYSFTVNDENAAVAAVSVVPQSESAEIGKNFTLNINNISAEAAAYVDSATVTIDVPSKYGNAVKDNLAGCIEYGSRYEQAAAPVYSNGKITISAKKKTTSAADTSGTIASISFPIPDSAKSNDSFSYAVQGSYVTSGGGYTYTFSQGEQTISLSAEYNITAGQAIVGHPVAFEVTDKNGNPVTKGIGIYKADGTEITNPYTFTSAGRITVYAKDGDGKRSWNTDIVVSGLGTDGNGAPYGIQNNGSKDGSTMRNITWLAAIGNSQANAVIKYGTAADNLDNTVPGNSRLFTFVQTTSGDAYRLNSISLTGLEPATTYYYQVGDGNKWSEVMSFTTATADKSADTKFFIFGDIQTDITANLADAITRVKDGGYSFGIQTGDAIDNVTAFAKWRSYLNNINSSKMAGIDMIHTLGNHEYYGDADGDISKGMFGLTKSSQGSYNSYEYGSMYVGVINDGGDILKALDAAKEDIKSTKCVWKALVMHQPIYGTESLMDEAKRPAVVEAIENAGFDVVFSGDDHTYARTYPMKADNKLDAGNREGVVYYICGDLSGKDNAYSERDIFASMIPHKDYQGMYMSVDASNEKLVLTAYKSSGDLLDSYTITRTDCELGKHSFDENSIYDVDNKTITCKLCNKNVIAADSKYTGKLKTKDNKGEVMLVNGVAKTGWFPLGSEICHAGEDGILHNYTTTDTATCLENGYLKSTCECGAVYKGSSTWSKGHSWDSNHVCTVCGTTGKNIENVKFDIEGKYWEYTGAAIRASIPAKDGDYTLSASSSRYGKDAYKSYSNNVNVGKGKVTFEGRGNYYGSKSVEFPIVPKSVKEITAGAVYSTSATVKWDAAAGAGYYRVYMRTSGSGWSKIAVTEETNVLVDNLKPNTKYMFIVAASTDVDGETFNCMRWSNELSITTPTRDSNTAASQINSIKAKVGTVDIKAVAKGGEHYLMLPASADMTALNLVLDLKGDYSEIIYSGAADTLKVDKDAVIDVTKLTGKNTGNDFDIRIAMKDCEPMTLHIMKSQSISSIHLTSDDAADKGRAYVDAVKGNNATGNMRMIGVNGNSIYDGKLKQIKARGNSTFQYYDKKSYQIKLETGADLLGKGENVKTWVLLAGYGDATQMHDKLIKDMAAALGMEYVANCNWVDLFYDGEYRGTYLLSEKNSVGTTGIDITDMEKSYAAINENYGSNAKTAKGLNDYGQEYQYITGLTEPDNITGGYLLERNLDTIDEICGFYTKQGSGFNIKSPEFAGKDAVKYISEYYQEFEDAVYADNGYNAETGKYYYDYCDVDSLVKVYLLQKLAYNVDGFKSSFYFYKDKDGKMYAGPVWDQEMTFGTGWSAAISADEVTYSYLEKALIKIPDFKQRVEAYYASVFKDKMLALLGDDGAIAGYYETISPSAEMNYVLWPYVRIGYPKADGHLWPNETNYETVVKDMTDWVAARADKLDELYGDGTLHMHHKYVEEITKEATYDDEGLKTYRCSVCDNSYTEVIPKLIRPASGGDLVTPGTETGKSDKPENVEIKIDTEVKQTETGKASATAEITDKAGEKLVSEAVSGDSEKAILDITTPSGSSEITEITLQGKTLNDFAEKTTASMVVKTDKAEVTLDNIALAAIAVQAGDNKVTLIIETVKSNNKEHIVKLKIVTADGTIRDFKGGKVNVTVEMNDALKAKKLVCLYLDDKNIYHKVKSDIDKDGRFTFTTGHFSTYAIMSKTDADKVIKKQLKALIDDVKIKTVTKKTSKGNIKVTAKTNVLAITDAGYTVKYKFYRSTKAKSGYKAVTVKSKNSFVNSKVKKGTKYYYKAKLMIYDDSKQLVGNTKLKQCTYSGIKK